jgi:L-aspartate oxidase
VAHLWDEVRRLMWNFVGIVRSDKRLQAAHQRLNQIHQEVNDYYSSYTLTDDLIELRNLVQTAQIIVESALSRKESRGLHYNVDHPELKVKGDNSVIIKP